MNNLKIILLCSSRFAIPALKELAFFKLLAVVAIPRNCDEMTERVEAILQGSGIPILQLDQADLTHQLQQAIKTYEINLGLGMTFSFKIPADVFCLPVKGFYNVHPGPLPQYRGADPIFQQIKNQEKKAGVTVHKVDEGIDTGAVVICEMIKLNPLFTYGQLTTQLAHLGAKLTGVLIKMLGFDIDIPSRPQDETKVRYYKKQQAKDIVIEWATMDASSIVALINACNPWNKGAVVKINQEIVRLLVAEKMLEDSPVHPEPGYIISMDEKGMVVSAINREAINVKMIYADEGFLTATSFSKIGLAVGQSFNRD